MKITLVLISLIIFGVYASQVVWAGELQLELEGLKSNQGIVMVGLYNTEAAFSAGLGSYKQPNGFLKDVGRLIGLTLRVDSGLRTAIFSGLKPGLYAIGLFHDANANGILDSTLGMPTEGYGFSNNAMGFMKAPDFSSAAVRVGSGEKTIKIKLRN